MPLYPPIEPDSHGLLPVSDGHEIYWETSGNPGGIPVVLLHGGPGAGTEPRHRRFFDPAHYRIVLLDQRGCGRSRPLGQLEGNTTWDLVEDLERLRRHLEIDRWMVFGGSWGSTLAVAYAEEHPEVVLGLILRGIFLFTTEELDWYLDHGTPTIFPDAWEELVGGVPTQERGDLLGAFHRRLCGNSPEQFDSWSRAWYRYEGAVATLHPDPDLERQLAEIEPVRTLARIECHYFQHHGFLENPDQLVERLDRIDSIPTTIVQGRWDALCPIRNAWTLHRRLPESKLVIVSDAGHDAFEPGIIEALVEATDSFARR